MTTERETETTWVALSDPDVKTFLRRGIAEAEASDDGGRILFTLNDGTQLRVRIGVYGFGTAMWHIAA